MVIFDTSYANAASQLQREYEQGKYPHQPVIEIGGKKVARALSIKETLETQLEDFARETNADGSVRSLKQRAHVFYFPWESCGGVVYAAEPARCRILPVCKELIALALLPEAYRFGEFTLQLPYESLEDGVELDLSKVKCGEDLTKEEVLEHAGWLAAVEEDTHLLREYRDVAWAIMTALSNDRKGFERAMPFWIPEKIITNELRVLCLYDVAGYCPSAGLSAQAYLRSKDCIRFVTR